MKCPYTTVWLAALGTMCVAFAMDASQSFPADTPVSDQRLTVRVVDYVNLQASRRSRAQATAKRILSQAGVMVDFVECFSGGAAIQNPACAAAPGPTVLVLRIAQPRFALEHEQFGYALITPEGGVYITVFINPERRKATVGILSDGVLLGHAIAHEIGHLLLGTNSHSSSGIMRPVWRQAEEEWMAKGGLLLFNASQARSMRSALVARFSRRELNPQPMPVLEASSRVAPLPNLSQ